MYLCRVGRKRRSARGADRSMCSRLTRNNFCLSDGGCGCVRVERTSITGFLSRQLAVAAEHAATASSVHAGAPWCECDKAEREYS